MELTKNARTLEGESLEEFSRRLCDDRSEFCAVIGELAASGSLDDYAKIAEIISYAPLGNSAEFYAADRREPVGKRYIDAFISACRSCGTDERVYISVIIGAAYAAPESEYAVWQDAAAEYLTKRALADFDFVAQAIDSYDKKLLCVGALFRADRERAVSLLVDKAVYGKNAERGAARNALIGHPEAAETLMRLYERSNAHTRLGAVRALMLYKNDDTVREFLKEAAETDNSAAVRRLLGGTSSKPRTKAAGFFEDIMISGAGISVGDFFELLKKDGYAEVADRLFFYDRGEHGEMRILVFNDGKFFDAEDKRVKLAKSDKVYVLHPIDISNEFEYILSYDVDQPFAQIKRPLYFPSADETYHSVRLAGAMSTRREFDENFRRGGFVMSADEGGKSYAVRFAGEYAVAAECHLPNSGDTVDCGKLVFFESAEVVKSGRKLFVGSAPPVAVRTIPKRIYSELVYAVYKLFGCAE